jgi:nanoRNase/pAp phosphatase (c-di-AMP/oligoRNAs hydrolase)
VVHHLAWGSLANPYPEAELVLVLHDTNDWDAETAEIFLNSLFLTNNIEVVVFGAGKVMTPYLRDMVELNGLPPMEEGSTVSDFLRVVAGEKL